MSNDDKWATIAFDSFEVRVPRGWADITDTIDAAHAPDSLARVDGVGALQFSIALHSSGPIPDPSPLSLLEMVREYGSARKLGNPHDEWHESGPPLLATGNFDWNDWFLRVWQISDGRNFAFVTFTCRPTPPTEELADCERIVRTIRFRAVE